MGDRGTCYWTAGQCLDARDVKTPFVWRMDPDSDMVTLMNYTNWYPGEPNNLHNKTESCMHLYTTPSYKWNDAKCHRPQCSVCEIDVDRSAEPMKQVPLAELKNPTRS